jgi:hypothetical protein
MRPLEAVLPLRQCQPTTREDQLIHNKQNYQQITIRSVIEPKGRTPPVAGQDPK